MPEARFVVMFIIIIVVLLLMIMSFSLVKRKKIKSKQAIGLQWLESMRLLLAYIQKHRGTSNGFLNGKREFLNDIKQLHTKIETTIVKIVAIDSSIKEKERWVSILNHWERIEANYQSFEADNNLVQHNQIIKNLLYLIDDVAQECELLVLNDQYQNPLHIYWRELLTAIEYIGQARAIGTGVSTIASCSSVSRIRLQYSCQKIESNTKALWKEIGSNKQQETCIQQLLECINKDLIGDKVTIKPHDFFAIATEAMEALFEQFDQMIDEQDD